MSTQETALATLESLTPLKIFTEMGSIDPILDSVEKEARERAAALDISTEKNRKELASLAFQIGKGKNRIDKMRLQLVSDEKERLKKIDREGARIWDRLEALQAEVRKPLTEWEQAETARIEKLERDVAALQDAADLGANPTIQSISARLAVVEAEDTSTYAEFTRRAELAKSDALHSLRTQLAVAQQRDAEQIELAKLRAEAAERAAKAEQERIEQEAKVRAEAQAALLIKEAEAKAERERKAAADKAAAAQLRAENEKRDAEARASKAEADALASVERERQRVADEAEAERKATEAREKDRKHRTSINGAALSALTEAGVSEKVGKQVIELIAKKMVPHVTIQY